MFVGWLELFLYYQDNRNLGGCAPQTPQKREIYTAPRRPHGPPRGGGFTYHFMPKIGTLRSTHNTS
nr:MAG TPA: hypothetical protein [Inoviridae sp.]